MEWQPIETAPKDGTRVLVAEEDDNESIGVAYWFCGSEDQDAGWYSSACVDDVTMFYPTHWIPLPQPPQGT